MRCIKTGNQRQRRLYLITAINAIIYYSGFNSNEVQRIFYHFRLPSSFFPTPYSLLPTP
ncbi:hypothetical protein [Moorena bouillonii]|uniref:hypothetical protein n=1 Tax=Moorena bouillonii TaxID=207920 RepID=UPI0013011F57|nr:hypothetical protein [Moorena bouillonii]